MRKIVRLKESDLEQIINRILDEQSVVGAPNYGTVQTNRTDKVKQQKSSDDIKFEKDYFCVPKQTKPFIQYLVKNWPKLIRDYNMKWSELTQYAKIAIGLMKRESDYGTNEDILDWGSRILYNVGLGSLVPSNVSSGAAQFTKDTWNRYGLDKKIGNYDDSLDVIKQGLGSIYRIKQDYDQAIKNGIPTTPSTNEILQKYGIISQIDGTGNAALDRAIIAHNYPGTKALVKYCKTSFPLIARPCIETTATPFKNESDWQDFKNSKLFKASNSVSQYPKNPGTIKVYQNQPIPNYFPNLYSGKQTALGYVEEVAAVMKSLDCF